MNPIVASRPASTSSKPVAAHVERVVRGGGDEKAWGPDRRAVITKAVFDSVFGIGKLQPLIELEGVENIHIPRFDRPVAYFADGTRRKLPPVARSDAEFLAELQFIAAHVNGTADSRPFSATDSQLDLDLPGGARLTATTSPTERHTSAVIRVHRFVDVTLEDMAGMTPNPDGSYDKGPNRSLTPESVPTLTGLVKASRRIAVAGPPGSGKTTLMRALCNSIDPFEPIATIEKEYELFLDEMGDRHEVVYPMKHRQGQGERLADGTTVGAVTVSSLFEQALRKDVRRIIVGEARSGVEIDAMFQAFQSGVGGMCTIHAESAAGTIGRIALLAVRNPGVNLETAHMQIAHDIDVIIHMDRVIEGDRFRRVVTEIAQVESNGDNKAPTTHPLFVMDPVTHDLVRVGMPHGRLLQQLLAAGVDVEGFLEEGNAA